MVRKLTAALLGVGVLVPGLANALGLGEIKLNSHLSEPLDAEIELVQTRELTESEILPGLAAPEDFNSAGVERFHHLTDMKFEVVVNNNGRSYVKVKTRKPIREPFVNFLVEVHWPAGRLLREYTLLLDPPNFSLAAPQPVQPAVTTTAAPTTVKVTSEPAPTTQPAVQAPVASQPAQALAASGDGKTYGPTKSSDSLWSIARALRPSSDVSIQQTMISIQQLNPDAFINGNINLLKKGKILRGPSTEEARQLTSREAINMVNQQNRAWKDRVSSNRTVADTESAQIDTSGRAVDSFEEAVRSDEGRLRLVSAETESESSSSTGQGGTDSEAGGVLRERAELAEESADQFRLENDDLKSKVNELEEQVGTGEKLLDLKDDQIAALQARLAKLEEDLNKAKESASKAAESAVAVVEPVIEPVVEEPPVVEAAAPEVEEVVAEDASEPVDYNFEEESQPETVVTQTSETQDPEVVVEAEPEQAVQVEATPKEVVVEAPESEVPTAPKKEQSLVEQILGNPLYMAIIGGGVAVIAVLGLIIGRRRGESEDELDEALVEDFSLNVDEEPPSFDEEQVEESAEPGEETVAQTADVLGEADIYIAYGRFPQAIEMLEKAAEAEPQRGDIRIKLLETSMEAQDQDTFMRHYQEVQELGVPSDMDRANALKGQFIGDGEVSNDFVEDADGDDTLVMGTDLGGVEEASSDLDFNLDDDGDTTLVQPAPDAEEGFTESAEAEADDSEFSLDFDVDSEIETEPAELDATSEEVVEDETSLDFDLDLDAGLDEITSEDVVDTEEENLDSEFSLDLTEDDSEDTEVSFGEAEESLDFELAEESEEAESTEESLEFDLDLDSVDADVAEDVSLDEDATIVASPVISEDESPSDDVIGSMEAAKLADELDLDGDFSLDIDTGLESPVETEAEAEVDFEVEADLEPEVDAAPVESLEAPAIDMEAPSVVVAPTSAEAANGEEEMDFLSDADEASTKLDLARAYIDMGDREGAKDILDEVLIEGSDDQQGEAKELLARLD